MVTPKQKQGRKVSEHVMISREGVPQLGDAWHVLYHIRTITAVDKTMVGTLHAAHVSLFSTIRQR